MLRAATRTALSQARTLLGLARPDLAALVRCCKGPPKANYNNAKQQQQQARWHRQRLCSLRSNSISISATRHDAQRTAAVAHAVHTKQKKEAEKSQSCALVDQLIITAFHTYTKANTHTGARVFGFFL